MIRRCWPVLLSAALAAQPSGLQALLKAYPELASVEADVLLWPDGTRMTYDDGRRTTDLEARLEHPSLYFQMAEPYPRGEAGIPPIPGADPGRVRFEPFFRKLYGQTSHDIERNLVTIPWLGRWPLRVTRIHGVDRRLRAVSEELLRLPPALRRCAEHPSGAYSPRPIAGTSRPSAHTFGIAIDLATTHADYWRWSRTQGGKLPPYRNRIPIEVVRIFEQHGFIWGGKWSHFDTMHFEYRPELLVE